MKRPIDDVITPPSSRLPRLPNNKDYTNQRLIVPWGQLVNGMQWRSGQLVPHAKRRCGERYRMSSYGFTELLNGIRPTEHVSVVWDDSDLRRIKVHYDSNGTDKHVIIIQNCDIYGFALPFYQWRVITCYPVVTPDVDAPINEGDDTLDFGYEFEYKKSGMIFILFKC